MNSVSVRGCPMTTGAHEVMTVAELQHLDLLGGGDGGGTLTPRVRVNSVAVRGLPMTTGAHEVMTIAELHHPVLLGGGEGGGTLTPKCPVKIM